MSKASESGFGEIFADIGSEKLQYCKRVKYMEKAWILAFKDRKYYWIDQDKIPLDKI